jgi:ribosomal protein RSM22 (predicted rRNA methylase)
MQLPPSLRHGIDQELAACNPAQLRAAADRLSQCYRRGEFGAPRGSAPAAATLADDLQRAAYLAVRMPATFAAVAAALGWTRQACGNGSETQILTMLDLGSGPGTALWAAAQVFPSLASATAIERDSRFIEIARRLAQAAEVEFPSVLRNTHWLRGDLTARLPEGRWDLVVCSYAVNELAGPQRAELIRQAWARTAKLLVVIEPGTMAGFANVLAARTQLLASNANQGAILAAPCPHSLACPMAGGGDWCHFAARVERTASHRRLKDATLGHEDEKFSYVGFMRGPVPFSPHEDESQIAQARIVRHPRIFSGYAQLTLCREEGHIAAATVTRSQKEDWRRLKRLGWGDRW